MLCCVPGFALVLVELLLAVRNVVQVADRQEDVFQFQDPGIDQFAGRDGQSRVLDESRQAIDSLLAVCQADVRLETSPDLRRVDQILTRFRAAHDAVDLSGLLVHVDDVLVEACVPVSVRLLEHAGVQSGVREKLNQERGAAAPGAGDENLPHCSLHFAIRAS